MVLLYFDITNLDSLHYLSKFPEMMKGYKMNIPTLLIGNKGDLRDLRRVEKERGKLFVKDNDLMG